MHVTLQFGIMDNFEIPLHYNHILQGVIYSSIDPLLADFLHSKGFVNNGRSFKLFTFSKLNGKYEINREKKSIKYFDEISITISSPVKEFCNSIAKGLLTKEWIDIGGNRAELRNMSVCQYKVENEGIRLRTLSPVVTYSTLLRPDGRKYTCYFQPGESDFNRIVDGNLRKKYQAYHNEEAPAENVEIEMLGQVRMHVMNYKHTVIKGYSGKLQLFGPEGLLQMAVDAGLGSKNSQGFGCVEEI